MAKEYRLAFAIPIICWESGIRYFILPPVHPKGRFSKSCRVLIPPAQSHLFPLMPILIEKMDARRQALFWAFEEYFNSGMSD